MGHVQQKQAQDGFERKEAEKAVRAAVAQRLPRQEKASRRNNGKDDQSEHATTIEVPRVGKGSDGVGTGVQVVGQQTCGTIAR